MVVSVQHVFDNEEFSSDNSKLIVANGKHLKHQVKAINLKIIVEEKS